MLSASLRRFQAELCAREVLQLMRIWDKQPMKFTGSGVGDVLSTSQPGLKRDQPPETPKMLLFFQRDALLEGTCSPVSFKSCFFFGMNSWCSWVIFPRNPKGAWTDLYSVFTRSVCYVGPEAHPSWSWLEMFWGQEFFWEGFAPC